MRSIGNCLLNGQPLKSLRLPGFICPNEARDEGTTQPDGSPRDYIVNYAVNNGVWMVYDPSTRAGGTGAFLPGIGLRAKDFSDGLSNTLMLAEVKAWQPYLRDGNGIHEIPEDPEAICSLPSSGQVIETGHTEWVNGQSLQSGFTASFTPNTSVLCDMGGEEKFDVDWNSHRTQGWTISNSYLDEAEVTFAAVTSRSYHSGNIVNVANMDGSVNVIDSDINRKIWRAMATRDGGEIVLDN